ncbi:MAG: DUF2807 domain-containing protein [Marinilabiliaceae bacterium]|jgi:hypothetical protein|nr:DUF2807 domain-containing protein [Marinilabiliaceae bacterium]
MKKLTITALAIMLAMGSSFAQSKKNIDADDFSSVAFGVMGELELQQGSSFKVVLEGDDDLLDAVSVRVRDGRLLISKPDWRKARNKKLYAYVTMPEVEGVSVSGSGRVFNKGSIECDDLSLSVSGSGNIEFDSFSADKVKMSVSGSGEVSLEGKGADEADVSISGSGNVDAEDFKFEDAVVSISGSGKCTIWVTDAIRARISGSGDVYVKGDPNIDSRSSGSGKIRKY